jgi:hypothetical protein
MLFTSSISYAPVPSPGSLIWSKRIVSFMTDYAPTRTHDRPIAVDDTGVYIVGYDNKKGNERWRIEKRSLTDGSLTWLKTSNPSSGEDKANGVAVDDTGVYIVGYDNKKGNMRWRIEKRSISDGGLLWRKTSNPSSGSDVANSVAVDETGVYIVGYDNKKGNERWRIEKRSLADGSLLWRKTTNPSSGNDRANSVAVDDTGVYIVGNDEKHGENDDRWRIEKRSLTDGSLIWIKTKNPLDYPDEPYSVAVYGSDIYIVGYDSVDFTDQRSRIEKRSTVDGSLIWFKHQGNGYNLIHGVAVDASGVYIIGPKKLDIITMIWRIEKRYH